MITFIMLILSTFFYFCCWSLH